jgi:hypothetical protein
MIKRADLIPRDPKVSHLTLTSSWLYEEEYSLTGFFYAYDLKGMWSIILDAYTPDGRRLFCAAGDFQMK